MSEAIQSPMPEGAAPPPRPRADGSVGTAMPTQRQLLDAQQQQLRALGEELRQAREARGLSDAALAYRLRLGQERLQALERGDTQRLPELVFVIAQLRRVAGALDLDLGDKLDQLSGRGPAAASATRRATPSLAPPACTSPQATLPQATPPQATPAGVPARTTPPSSSPSLANQPLPAGASHPKATLTPGFPAHPEDDLRSPGRGLPRWWLAPLLGLTLLAVALAFGPGRRGGPTPPGASRAQNPSSSAQARGGPARPGAPSPVAAPHAASPARRDAKGAGGAAASLHLQASQASWLEVRSGNGELLFRGTFQGVRRFPVQAGLRLLPGRPDLIVVASDGQPARQLGPISAVVWYRFPAAPSTGNQTTNATGQPVIPAAPAPQPARP